MRYLIDFSDTLFDYEAFRSYQSRRATADPFAPGELAEFLYPDARSFLIEKGNSSLIITLMTKETDSHLIMSALAGIPRMSVMYTAGKLKGEFLAPYISLYGEAPVFADDSPAQLSSMALHCPETQLFEVRRDGGAGDGRWPVIRTLAELPGV
jgi:hypothetical protein